MGDTRGLIETVIVIGATLIAAFIGVGAVVIGAIWAYSTALGFYSTILGWVAEEKQAKERLRKPIPKYSTTSRCQSTSTPTKTIALQNVMACDTVPSEPDIPHWDVGDSFGHTGGGSESYGRVDGVGYYIDNDGGTHWHDFEDV
jgi:hypothetical protein